MLDGMPPRTAAMIVLLVFVLCALFIPAHQPSNDSANTNPAYEAAYHYPPETWIALGATFFTGLLAVFAFPARDIRAVMDCHIGDATGITNVLPLSPRATNHPSMMLAPGHPFHGAVRLYQTASRNHLIGQGLFVYFFGRMDYRDAFGDERWTTFQLFGDLELNWSLGACAVGNDADC